MKNHLGCKSIPEHNLDEIKELKKKIIAENSILLVGELRKIHRFIDASQRLIDVRGRNGFLVILRKIVVSSITLYLEDICDASYVLRYGGNKFYILANGCQSGIDIDTINNLVDLVNYMIYPAVFTVRIFRGDSSKITEVYRYTGLKLEEPNVAVRAGIEGNSIYEGTAHIHCNICGRPGKGVLSDIVSGNRLLLHVVREEKTVCAVDLLFRLLGRILNKPYVITIAVNNPREFIPEAIVEDVVEVSVSSGKGENMVKLVFKAFRHLPENLNLEDSGIIGMELNTRSKRYRVVYIIIGLRNVEKFNELLENVRKKADEIRKSLIEKDMYKLDSLYKSVYKCVEESKKFSNTLLSTLKEISRLGNSVRIQIFTRYLSSIISPIRELSLDVTPPLYPRKLNEKPAIDAEMTYINLGGRNIVDLDTIAIESQTNTVALIRSDGDHFGVLASPYKLYEVLKREYGILADKLRKNLNNLGINLDTEDKFQLSESDPLLYIWDHIVEKNLVEYLKYTLFVEALVNSELKSVVIYVGGDENLFITPVTGRDEEERFENLVLAVLGLRELILFTAYKIIEYFAGIDYFEKIYRFLIDNKIATLSSSIILIHPKFPAYVAQSILNKLVDLAKEAGRDSLIIFNLDTVILPYPSTKWLKEPITVPLTNNIHIIHSYSELRKCDELRDIFLTIYRFCIDEKCSYTDLIDTSDSMIETLYELFNLQNNVKLSTELFNNGTQRPAYGVYVLFKNIERGL